MFGQKRLQNSNLNRGLIECFVLCCFVLYFKTLFEVYSSVHVHTVHRMEHSALQQYLRHIEKWSIECERRDLFIHCVLIPEIDK